MKKLALLVAVAVAAATPSVALAAKKKAAAKPAAATTDLNANSKKLMRSLAAQPSYVLQGMTQPIVRADAKAQVDRRSKARANRAARASQPVDPNANSKKFVRALAMQPSYVLQGMTQPVVRADAKAQADRRAKARAKRAKRAK